MYLLSYLQEIEKAQRQAFDLNIEFRLACSGEFYNRKVDPRAWRSLDRARLLLRQPFELYVVSRPFNAFPQEICLRFGLNYVWDCRSGGGSVGTTPPYDDLVEDICAVLTLLSRRLVIPAVEVRVLSARKDEDPIWSNSFNYDHPSPIVGLGNLRSRILRTSRSEVVDGAMTLVEHTPPPLGIDSDALEDAFISIAQSQYASVILQAARAYSSALQLILTRPEQAYQLLISSVETLANTVCSDFRPSERAMIEHKRGVQAKAREFGLSADQADALAVEACKGVHWASRKFRTFFSRFGPSDVCGPDDVFPLADGWEPRQEDLEKVLKAIYEARSKHLHEGKEFPGWIARGATVAVPASWYPLPENASQYVPPVTWFERLVSLAVNRFLANERTTSYEEPFLRA